MLIDGFSGLFLILISLMGSIVAFYCIGYMEYAHYAKYNFRLFYFCFPLFVAGMLALVVVDDLTSGFTIAWQMMTITSYFLIRFENDNPKIVYSANKYLVLMQIAWALIFVTAMIIPGAHFGDDLHQIATAIAKNNLSELNKAVIFIAIITGFAIKAGMFPFGQIWLPDAHSSAPSPISALLSGVMIKTGVYGIARTFFWLMPSSFEVGKTIFTLLGQYLGLVLAIFGVISLFIGTIQALKQHDAKCLHAYHSIGQMGYILLALGLAQSFINSPQEKLQLLSVLVLFGAIAHLLHHAVFKALLFLCTGSVQFATNTKDIDSLGGLYKYLPFTTIAAAVASAAIAGIPAFSGFVSKWAIISGSMLAGSGNILIAFFGITALITSAITLASYVKFFGMSFTASGIEWTNKNPPQEVGVSMLIPKYILVVFCVIQGLFPAISVWLIINIFSTKGSGIFAEAFLNSPNLQSVLSANISGLGFNWLNSNNNSAFVLPIMLLVLMLLLMFLVNLLRKSAVIDTRQAAVWLGGYQDLNNQNRYQASHIYASFKHFMRWTGAEVKHQKVIVKTK